MKALASEIGSSPPQLGKAVCGSPPRVWLASTQDGVCAVNQSVARGSSAAEYRGTPKVLQYPWKMQPQCRVVGQLWNCTTIKTKRSSLLVPCILFTQLTDILPMATTTVTCNTLSVQESNICARFYHGTGFTFSMPTPTPAVENLPATTSIPASVLPCDVIRTAFILFTVSLARIGVSICISSPPSAGSASVSTRGTVTRPSTTTRATPPVPLGSTSASSFGKPELLRFLRQRV